VQHAPVKAGRTRCRFVAACGCTGRHARAHDRRFEPNSTAGRDRQCRSTADLESSATGFTRGFNRPSFDGRVRAQRRLALRELDRALLTTRLYGASHHRDGWRKPGATPGPAGLCATNTRCKSPQNRLGGTRSISIQQPAPDPRPTQSRSSRGVMPSGEDLRIRLSCCRGRQPSGRAIPTKRGRRFIRFNTKRNQDRSGQA
jgi:hypothetical protein